MTEQGREYHNPRLNELAALKHDWDSYGSYPISPAALAAADAVTFIPCSNGGMQVEFHHSGQDIEVYIDPSGRVSGVYLRNAEVERDD